LRKRGGEGFGGFLIGLGITWIFLRYINVGIQLGPSLLVITGITIILLSYLNRLNNQYSEIIRGLLGGVILAVIFSSISGFDGWSPFGSGIVGSTATSSKTFDLRDYSKVIVSNGFHATLSSGSSYQLSVTVNENLVDYLNVRKESDTLRIGLKPGSYSNTRLQAQVTMPSLSELILSDGSHVEASRFDSMDLLIRLSDGSEVTLSGSADSVQVFSSDGSRSFLSEFKAHNAKVTYSDGSHGSVYANGRLDVDLSDGSHLDYYGNPTIGNINLSGGSTINPK
jgi:hypothetical protein